MQPHCAPKPSTALLFPSDSRSQCLQTETFKSFCFAYPLPNQVETVQQEVVSISFASNTRNALYLRAPDKDYSDEYEVLQLAEFIMTAVLSGLQTDTQLQTLTRILTISPEPETDPITIHVTSTDTRASSSTFISSQITDVPSSISSEATVSSDASKATVSSNASSMSAQSSAKPAGANAGIGIGASLGVLLLLALVVYITILRRRSKKASRENAPPAGPAIPPPGIPELGSEGQKYELMGDKALAKASPVSPDGRTPAHELES